MRGALALPGIAALVLALALALAPASAPVRRPSTTETVEVPGTDVSFRLAWIPGVGLWVGTTEVTWDAYEAWFLGKDVPHGADAATRPTKPYLPYDRGWGTGTRPAVGVSRHAAEQYCVWLSERTGDIYRLPTEPEWEAACRASGEPADVWCAERSGGRTRPTGSALTGEAGLQDMLGNAWEYCSGDFAPGDPRPVMRGGCWDTPFEECLCAARRACPKEWNDSDAQRPRGIWWLADGPYVGFRIVREPSQDEAATR